MTDRSEKDAARDAAMQRHFMVTGEVVWEWNALHRTLGYIFMCLLGDRQTHVSNALWLTPGSDKAQRDLLKTAVDWADGLREVDRERLGWVLDQADKLGAHRNDIVHGYPGFLITENGLTTHLSSGQNSLRRVMKQQRIDTPFHELMAALCDDLRRLERPIPQPDPCARFGPRFRPGGWAAKFATGLYVPEMSGAKADQEADR